MIARWHLARTTGISIGIEKDVAFHPRGGSYFVGVHVLPIVGETTATSKPLSVAQL